MYLKTKITILIGPTATGKTSMAVQLAEATQGEIISADSRQIYRGMDLGSGKDLSEYRQIPFHLIDILEPSQEFSASMFQERALLALTQIAERKKHPIICGGTAHYIKALIEDYPFAAQGTNLEFSSALEKESRQELLERLQGLGLTESMDWDKQSKRRMARAIEKKLFPQPERSLESQTNFKDRYQPMIFAVTQERAKVIQNIEARLDQRFEQGMIQEVEELKRKGLSGQRLERFGLEYKWIHRYLEGTIDFKAMREKLATEIRRFAKRQMTFIRYLEKSGHKIHPVANYEELESMVLKNLRQ